VGIGASAGGLEAFSQLLQSLPADTGMAFVLVQHLDPKHASRLGPLLANATPMPVCEAEEGQAVRPGHVYIIPPDTTLTVAEGVLHLAPRGESHGLHLPIDRFLQSLAADRGAGAIGVILSGSGSDGTLGLEEIKAEGGITFAQDEVSARYSGMPHSAESSGCVDFVLPPEAIARELARIGRHPYLSPDPAAEGAPPADDEDLFRKALELLRGFSGVEFRDYRETTIRRRILRRMLLHNRQELADYVRLLEEDRSEVEALYEDVLINVTRFFREPETFAELQRSVFPGILKARATDGPVRIWVPGCSTGQEAYSLAMALLEVLAEGTVRIPIQIFATDLSDGVSLRKAREGLYPESIEAEVTPERLRRFFTKEDGGYRIVKSIRDMCVFARHNVAADPPFSRVDLVSCRNLLIYLAPRLQRRIIPTFHYALNPGGFLLLGSAETIGPFPDLFAVADPRHRIYVKREVPLLRYPHFQAGEPARPVRGVPPFAAALPAAVPPPSWQREAGRLLQVPGGGGGPAGKAGLRILPVELPGSAERCFLVVLDEARPMSAGPEPVSSAADVAAGRPRRGLWQWLRRRRPAPVADLADVEVLHRDLRSTRESLQAVIEVQDAANEELRSANEEALSANEELQSTNEELETAKEELQSVNEELTTLNEQLQNRSTELRESRDETQAIVETVRDPLLVLDSSLRVQSANRAFYRMFGSTPAETEGRLLYHLRQGQWDIPELRRLLEEVLPASAAFEGFRVNHDFEGIGSRVLLLNARRILREDRETRLILLAIEDITERTRLEEELRRSADQLAEADRRKDQFLATLAHELRNPLAPLGNALQILRLAATPAQAEQARELMERQVRQMTRLIDDLLDVSRITLGRIDLRRERIELAGAVNQSVETCRASLAAAGHELAILLPAETLILDADPVRLTQILENLLTNAIRYTDPGGRISLTVSREGDEALFRLSDSGVGIAPEKLHQIWEPFVQADPSIERSRTGLGIGLTLVRKLVRLHGGTVEVHSAGLGHGSEFLLRLPLAGDRRGRGAEAKPPPAEAALPSARPLRVLVVDDNLDQAESFCLLLEMMGQEVRMAHDGPAALVAAAGFRPELVLLDIGLPGMSGFEVARRLRQAPGPDAPVVIAVSGYGTDEDRRRSQEAGFDAHWVKPVELDVLRQMIAELAAGPALMA